MWSIIEVIKAWIRHTFILMLPNGLWSSHLVRRQMSSTGYGWLSTWTPSIALCSSGTAAGAQLEKWAEGTCTRGSPCAGAISFTAAATRRSIFQVQSLVTRVGNQRYHLSELIVPPWAQYQFFTRSGRSASIFCHLGTANAYPPRPRWWSCSFLAQLCFARALALEKSSLVLYSTKDVQCSFNLGYSIQFGVRFFLI
jgi:hypothetical protein